METLVLLYWGILLSVIIAGAITTIVWLTTMPDPESTDPCHPRCWLPQITTGMWTDHEYRCRDCGRRWRIEADMGLPRERHRYWAAR